MTIKTRATVLIEQAIDVHFGEVTRPIEDRSLALGCIISERAEFDGNEIVEVFFAALEDANFHKERELFAAIWLERHGEAI